MHAGRNVTSCMHACSQRDKKCCDRRPSVICRFWRFPGKWRPSPSAALVFAALVPSKDDAEVGVHRKRSPDQAALAPVAADDGSAAAAAAGDAGLAADPFRLYSVAGLCQSSSQLPRLSWSSFFLPL